MCVAGNDPGGPKRCASDSRRRAAGSRVAVCELEDRETATLNALAALDEPMEPPAHAALYNPDTEYASAEEEEQAWDDEVDRVYEAEGIESCDLFDASQAESLYMQLAAAEPRGSREGLRLAIQASAYGRRIAEFHVD